MNDWAFLNVTGIVNSSIGQDSETLWTPVLSGKNLMSNLNTNKLSKL